MAEEGGSSQEKTEDATPKRLREARKKGQVARSRDLNTVVILIGAFAALAAMTGFFYDQMKSLIQASIQFISKPELGNEELLQFAGEVFRSGLMIMAPYLGIVMLVALLVGFLQVGPIFSTESISLQMKRLNIVENIKNMAKITTLVELIKNILKVFFVFFIAYLVVKKNIGEVVATVTGDIMISTQLAGKIVMQFLLRVFVLFAMLVIIDVMVQRWNYKKQLRMSKEEVKREYKQDEGDPLIKSMRRQLYQELAMGDVRRQVAASDVVVTNPTELAVALKYDDKEMMAPQIMAKGQRLFAQTIRDIAKEEGIPIMRNVPLAWSLIEIDIGGEVPEELYAAVAEVLVIVYRMKSENQSPS